MLGLLLPQRIDNDYRGQKIALALFALLVLLKGVIGFNSIFHGAMVAGSADGIPLDTFGPEGARTVILLFALLGLAQLGGKLIHRLLTVTTNAHAPGGIVTLVVYSLTIAGLVLSLWRRRSPQPPA